MGLFHFMGLSLTPPTTTEATIDDRVLGVVVPFSFSLSPPQQSFTGSVSVAVTFCFDQMELKTL